LPLSSHLRRVRGVTPRAFAASPILTNFFIIKMIHDAKSISQMETVKAPSPWHLLSKRSDEHSFAKPMG
ncbi:hypothetical protein, partial [Thioclava sp. IC9]|uniref:hypothetical protein n=1 Tax=Thioclava sp. IC9 TaxID=1973007 RepID=UPI001F0AB98E